MQQHTFLQGSPEWHAYRVTSRNASDAPAVLGCSAYQTRSDLLHARHTGLRPEATPEQERRFAAGHAIEAAQLPGAEEVIGESLYPVVGSAVVDGIELSASFDGLTMLEDTAYECKTLNDNLREALPEHGCSETAGRDLPKMYRVQMEQQLAVCGGERVLFVAATKDGSDVRRCWYYQDLTLRAEIVAAWRQFDRDLAEYAPATAAAVPVAKVVGSLPVVFDMRVEGKLVSCNLEQYKPAALAYIEGINTQLRVDQHFADAEADAKYCRESAAKLKLAVELALGQMGDVNAAISTVREIAAAFDAKGLALEKLVKAEKESIRERIVAKARSAYEAHIAALKVDTGGPWISLPAPDFAGAVKNKRTVASLQDAVETTLANAKIVADESARKIRAALSALADESKGYEHLFADRLAFVSKSAEDVRALARARITEHRAAEERRAAELAERERARIRAEEEERARATAAREQQEREAAERRQREEQEAAARQVREQAEAAERRAHQATMTHANGAPMFGESIKDNGDHVMLDAQGKRSVFCDIDEGDAPAAAPAPTANVHPMPTRAPAAPSSPPSLRLGQINERLQRCKVTADDLAALGFPAAGRDRAAVLFHEADFPRICDALMQCIAAARDGQKAAA